MLLNFANFLWDSAYFEETFRVFEFALSNFKWPSLHEIWLAYITKFITRHGNTAIGVERGRSMFERLLKDVPK
jgi:pre-mRNA-splicing factor SYF1